MLNRLFAVAMARKVGYQCSDHACFGVGEEWKEEDFCASPFEDAQVEGNLRKFADWATIEVGKGLEIQ